MKPDMKTVQWLRMLPAGARAMLSDRNKRLIQRADELMRYKPALSVVNLANISKMDRKDATEVFTTLRASYCALSTVLRWIERGRPSAKAVLAERAAKEAMKHNRT